MSEHKSTVIELKDGESINDAIKRMAAEAVANDPSLAQEPDSQSPQGESKKSKKQKVTVTDPSAGDTVDSAVYGAMHVYQREGEPEGSVRMNGTRERRAHGPNVLVFAHMHPYGEACSSSCRERLA